MCGICGMIMRDRARPADVGIIGAMNARQRHRGPDDLGVHAQGRAAFGHVRLSIVDRSSAGRQPLLNEDGSVWLTLNGEIYNHDVLRGELSARGHRFVSGSDAEIVLHLYEDHGVKALDHLEGMFALAIWDTRHETLLLARDRLGKKPLYYVLLSDRLLFASESHALLADPALPRHTDPVALHHYLAYQSIPAPYSVWQGVRQLPAAHLLTWRAERDATLPPTQRYWRLSHRSQRPEPRGPGERTALTAEILTRLRQAVKQRLMGEVPIGTFLSGGLDSSLVTALAAESAPRPLHTFALGFDEASHNELAHARRAADHLGTEHHEAVVTPDAATIALIPKLVEHYGEPFADASALPSFLVAQLARRHITVVLTGDGGDENFAGYNRYTNTGPFALTQSNVTTFWERWRRRSIDWGALLGYARDWRSALRDARRLRALGTDRWFNYLRLTHFHELYQRELYCSEFRGRLGEIRTVDYLLARYRDTDGPTPLDQAMAVDLAFYLPETLMPKVDRASMAHGLEARCPFLDHTVVEFAASLPASLKLTAAHGGKAILKEAARGLLPDAIIDRPKMGFGVPLDTWFRGPLRDLLGDTLLGHRCRERGYFRPEYVNTLYERHQRGENWATLLWNLLVFELWHHAFVDRPGFSVEP